MKKVFKKGICLFLSLLVLTSGIGVFAADTTAASTSTPRVFVIGDSTACSYDWESERTGWGEALQNFLTDPKMVVNAASAGESSHSFYDKEWHWSTVKARLKKGDYLLIQFGHNDCSEGENTDYRYYSNPALSIAEHDPESGQYSYKWYLKQYIDTAISVGAYPILVTSVERKTHLTSSASPLAAYADAMKALATEEVPVIDVWTEFRANAETATESWYVSDGVHLNEAGAMATAKIFANGIKASSAAYAQSFANYLVSNIDAVTTHTDILGINENFEDYTLPAEGNVGVGSPLEPTTSNVTEEKYAYIVAENESNNVVKLATTGGAHTVSYEFPRALSTGYYKLKYRFKSNGITTDMVFVTTIGEYPANTRYSKNSINKSGGDNLKNYGIYLTEGKWLEVEYYMDPANAKLDILCEGNHLGNWKKAGQLDNLKIISIGFPSSGAGTNAELYLDDIEFGEISEKDYNLAIGNIPVVTPPEGITAMEDFEYAKAGTAIGTTHYGWVNSTKRDNSHITYAQDPIEEGNNTVAKLYRNVQTIDGNHALAYNLSEPLSAGVYSAKFRIYADNENSNGFWISILDSANLGKTYRHNIYFKVADNTVGMYTTINGSQNTLNRSYSFEMKKWYDIEVVYDLTSESIYATVYVNNTKVINNVLVCGIATQANDGTISSIQLMLPTDGSATTLSPEDATEGETYASFLLDDIVIKQTSIVTGVAVAENVLSGVSAYFDAAPSASPKFVAAVYDGRALKDIAFASATAIAGSQSVSLSKALSVASGNTVKVYYWDMTNLIPCIKMFETDIQ